MIHFHTLTIAKIQRETEDSVSIIFHVPGPLKETFRFQQGQSLTVRQYLNGEDVRRTYSICSSPLDGILRIAVKKVEGGVFSSYANDVLKTGDTLDVMAPVGKFYTELHPAHHKNYVAFVAGSGITPVLSIIKTTLATEPESSFTLVFGNRSRSTIMFREELEALKDKYISRFRMYHILSREKTDAIVNYGRIDREKLELFAEKIIDLKAVDDFFLCGPEEMIFCVKDFLKEKLIPEEKLHFELFTVPGQNRSVQVEASVNQNDQALKSQVTIRLDGINFNFELGYEGESILDAALKQGADLPYACKGGVCTTCKAVLKEGKASMDVNWGLEPEEVEKGYILTCQAHPKSEKLMVDFDVR